MASTTMMSQQMFQSHQSQNKIMELRSPDGDLGDVEADFQSLVNEMAEDSNKRSQKVTSTSSTSMSQKSMSSSYSKITKSVSSSGISSNIKTGRQHNKMITPYSTSSSFLAANSYSSSSRSVDPSLVTALPARVVPEPLSRENSEIVIEKQMKVRDRVKRLEKQLSQESNDSSQPPEAIMPKGRSGSIRNIADQFENVGDQIITQEQSTARVATPTFRLEDPDARGVREIASAYCAKAEASQVSKTVNVKETASMFQEPFSPIAIKPPAPFSDNDAPEPVPPVPVLPPAMKKPTPEIPPSPPVALASPQEHPPLPWRREHSSTDLLAEQSSSKSARLESNYSESLARMEAHPTHYNAQVSCEVRSRVVPETTERKSRSEFRTTTSTSSSSKMSSFMTSSTSHDSKSSAFVPSAPTPLARTSAKPPRAESADSGLPKFSLLRSASAGSVDHNIKSGMSRTHSDKSLPKFNVKKVKSAAPFGASKSKLTKKI